MARKTQKYELSPQERIDILTKRDAALRKKYIRADANGDGRGREEFWRAMDSTSRGLADARVDLAAERRA